MSYDKIDAAFGNAKAAFGKLKIGVRMTKISEDKVHVVGQAKDLYNFHPWNIPKNNEVHIYMN